VSKVLDPGSQLISSAFGHEATRVRRRVRQRCVKELSEPEASLAERVRDERIVTGFVRYWRGDLSYSDRAHGASR